MGLCPWRGRVVFSRGCCFQNGTTEENTNPPFPVRVSVHTVRAFVFVRRRMGAVGGLLPSVVEAGRSWSRSGSRPCGRTKLQGAW